MPLIKKRKTPRAMLRDGGTAAWNTSWKRSHAKLPGAPGLTWINAAAPDSSGHPHLSGKILESGHRRKSLVNVSTRQSDSRK